MITIFGVYRSRASRNLWLLHETRTPFRLEPVIQAYRLPDPLAPDAPLNTRTPAYLAMNPMGGIPFMTDGPVALAESLAINHHIARTYGGDLGPRDTAEDARMVETAFFAATTLEPPALALMLAHRDHAGDPARLADLTAPHLAALARPLAVLEARLAHDGHAVGGRFTVADIALAEVLRYATAHPGALDPYPTVRTWLAAAHARPAFREMWARREAEPA
jgi:glutathione S-transferase